MISVSVVREDGRISVFEIKGHANFARHGKDIVCAAVSASAQTALLGLLKYRPDTEYTVGEEGYMKIKVPVGRDETESARLEAIAETLLCGLKDIRDGYKSYVKLEEV